MRISHFLTFWQNVTKAPDRSKYHQTCMYIVLDMYVHSPTMAIMNLNWKLVEILSLSKWNMLFKEKSTFFMFFLKSNTYFMSSKRNFKPAWRRSVKWESWIIVVTRKIPERMVNTSITPYNNDNNNNGGRKRSF